MSHLRVHKRRASVACILAEAGAVQVATVEEGTAHGAVLNGNSAAAAPGVRAMPPSGESAPPLAALCIAPPVLVTPLLLILAHGCRMSIICSHRRVRGAWAATVSCERTPWRTGKPRGLQFSILCLQRRQQSHAPNFRCSASIPDPVACDTDNCHEPPCIGRPVVMCIRPPGLDLWHVCVSASTSSG